MARHEALRVLRDRARQVPTEDETLAAVQGPSRIDADLVAAEREAAVWRAVESLQPRQQALLEQLPQDSPPSYEAITAKLGTCDGRIGPYPRSDACARTPASRRWRTRTEVHEDGPPEYSRGAAALIPS